MVILADLINTLPPGPTPAATTNWTRHDWFAWYRKTQKRQGPVEKPFDAAHLQALEDMSQDKTFDRLGSDDSFDTRDNMNPETFPEPDHERIPYIGWIEDPADHQ